MPREHPRFPVPSAFPRTRSVQLITYFVDVRAHVSPDCDDAANTNINANNNPPPGSAVASPGPNARTPQGIYVGADGRVSRAANGQAGAPPPPQDLEYVEDCVDLDLEAEQVDNTYLDGGDGGDVDQVAEVEDLVGDYEDEYGDEYGDDGGGEYGGGAPPLVPRPPVQLVHMDSGGCGGGSAGGEGLGGGGGCGGRGEGPRGGAGGTGAGACMQRPWFTCWGGGGGWGFRGMPFACMVRVDCGPSTCACRVCVLLSRSLSRVL